MRTRRRLMTAVSLFAGLSLVAAACGDDDDGGAADTEAPSPETTEAMTDTTAAEGPATTAAEAEEGLEAGEVSKIGLVFDAIGRGDGSFNDSAAAGYDRALEELTAAGVDVEGNEQVPAQDGSDRADKLSLLCTDGFNPVLAIGFLFSDPLAQVAPECADTSFGIVDSVVDAPNVAGLVFAEHEGSFLVGAAAALTSESGRIGFIGGLEGDLIRRFEAGYVAGAQAVNPDIEVDVKYLGTTVDAFNDPAGAKTSTEAMIEAGADVIYGAAGQSGLGMFEAVKEANEAGATVWAIGVDSDQGSPDNAGVPNDVKDYILTSMLKRVDVAVYSTIKAVNDGTFAAGPQEFNLEVDGVGYSTTGDHLGDDVISQLEDFKQQIIDGAIEVPSAP